MAESAAAGRRLVVLDDDPTGTQTISDLPVLTGWSVEDLRWALQQPTNAFFILTNTRSLSPDDAAERNRQIVRALAEASALEGVQYVVASRGDSTLRGHYPLETDVLAEELDNVQVTVDGVVIVPAYIEPGRLTVDSVHWMRTEEGMIPVGDSEFARDSSFGYQHSNLRDWVQEMTADRFRADQVLAITLTDLRSGGPDAVQTMVSSLRHGAPAVVDAMVDDDLQVLAIALIRAEAEGRNFLYRTGPSFVRARSGQVALPPVDVDRLRQIFARTGTPADDSRISSRQGVVVVGSHVGLTSRQLDQLRLAGHITELELDVPTLLDPDRRDAHVGAVTRSAVELLSDAGATADVVIRTSRALVTGADAHNSLAIARAVSDALVGTVRDIVASVRPAFVVAKGGITSSDTATEGLSIKRAWARGTLLPGIVSLWEPVAGPAQGIPYVVFAGNVGDDQALADVVAILRAL
ncbi:four-carbon acid sugar kinase family protein [Nakamurella sp. UYEF19]|uniref:four-carbon acid sugar kinase family protein n=1 Tax=Nakamurella sp. UYEF19 TaxID=1756392 RepID=UPI003391FA9A